MKSTAARRYAKALIEISIEDKACEKYGKELRSALAVFKGSDELMKVLLNPMYKIEERRAVMEKVSASLSLSPVVAKFFNVLVETRKIAVLEDIVEAYSAQADVVEGRIRAIVESPTELSPALLDAIKAKIAGTTGKTVLLSYKANPELIGGMVIRIGNTVLDASMKTQIELMKERIAEGAA